MSSLLADVTALAEGIGPRPSASAAEAEAARYLQRAWSAAGLKSELEPFRGLPSFSWSHGLLYSLSALAWPLFGLNRPGGAALAWISFFLFGLEIEGFGLISRLLSRRPSGNLLARVGEGPPRLVVSAHLDTSRAAIAFSPGQAKNFRTTFLLVALALLLQPLLLTLAVWWPRLQPWALVSTAVLVGAALLLVHREVVHRPVPGANDDASGLAVLLELGRSLHEKPVIDLPVWLLATGCEESGLLGMASFFRRHQGLDRETLFLNLDNLGTGSLIVTAAEGMLLRRPTAAVLQRMATEAAGETEVELRPQEFRTMSTDAQIPLSRGYPAASLMALDANGLLPNWHWYTDRPEAIEPENLAAALKLVRRLVENLAG